MSSSGNGGRPAEAETETERGHGRRTFAILGGLLVLATAAVIASLVTPAPHTGGDNAAYLSLAHALTEGLGYSEQWDPAVLPHTKYPPGLPLALGALILLGGSTWVAFKLMMAGWLSLAVILVFAWASERRGPVVGLAVASLTLISSGWLEASRWILSEPPFLAFTFLALWAAERGLSRGESPRSSWRWLAVAGAAAIAAFFTRSAGLPLVVALTAALLLARRWRAAAGLLGALAPFAAWWALRARRGGEGAYQAEFWMVDPYQPELGTVGWLDLPGRAWRNLVFYVGEVLPAEWWGSSVSVGLAVLGTALVALAVAGWIMRVRRGPAAAELFVPLYAGLILVWPEVWSGDRFLLPLHPFVLLYAGAAVERITRPVAPALATASLAAGFLVFALPAIPGWLAKAEGASACRRVAAAGDVFRCHGPAFQEFRDAAAWAGANLPDGAVVLNRKPRIHYVLGGPRGRTFPFTRDPAVLLEEADALGARYLLLDRVDGISPYYLPAVIGGRPGAFCHIAGWGGGDGAAGTDLFGILPPEARRDGVGVESLGPCPQGYMTPAPTDPRSEGIRVPRLVR